ncbi:MAG TPA: NAD(P)/FAD-dependent oxidoreductase [Gemmatimonadales bacterium]|nr:NAD(P)/FAD-dependent oxidoreductase [Gemmatimonadales bacterium]
MAPQRVWDVAIAGAGPAGATLACALLGARPDTRVCLLDRHRFPRDKACGDGIGPGVVRSLTELALLAVCEGFEPVELIRVRSSTGQELAAGLPVLDGGRPIGYVIPRLVFDHRLVTAAIGRGAADRTGQALQEAHFNAATGLWELLIRHDGAGERPEETIEAKVLVGADGARSLVRRRLGIPYNSPRHTGVSIRQYTTVEDGGVRALEFDFLPDLQPAYGWYFAVSDHRANIGVVCDAAVYKARKLDLDVLLNDQHRTLAAHHRLTPEADSTRSFILPYGSRLPPLAVGRAALIGDAASMINPITGEGLYYGTAAGALLGSVLAEALDRSVPLETALARYAEQFIGRFRRHFRANYLLKKMAGSQFWSRIAFKAAGRDRRILDDAVQLMMGDGDRLGVFNPLRVLARAI